jgi:hypothetical protein
MNPIGMILAVNATRTHVLSAMPNAPVEPVPEPRPRRTEPVRRGTAAMLRRLADLVEPEGALPSRAATG